MKITPIIMAGGSGKRLWPLSRSSRPKQFLSLNSNKSLLQETLMRLSALDTDIPIIICNTEHRFFVAEQIKNLNIKAKILLEPQGNNTAPAIAIAAMILPSDSLMLVLPSDHVIKNNEEFIKSIEHGLGYANHGELVTFGIKPTNAHTGYGYIKKGQLNGKAFSIEKFVEKPSKQKAIKYFKSKEYLWNSGMFVFKSNAYLDELQKYRRDIYISCLKTSSKLVFDDDFIRIDQDSFKKCPSESIDYAVMEKTELSTVVPMDAGWSDIGSWSSLWESSDKDQNNNVIKGDVLTRDTNNCYISSENVLVSSIDVNDLVIVATKDAILVSSKEKSQDVQLIYNDIKSKERTEWEFHREVHRPWGKYDSVDFDKGYQVKRITVKPGEKLSVQMHYHRSEHWVVVSGKARVHYGDNFHDLNVNESTYHDKEVVHALENPGDVDLELIEVQIGAYLGEDDIVRYDDIYGRLK